MIYKLIAFVVILIFLGFCIWYIVLPIIKPKKKPEKSIDKKQMAQKRHKPPPLEQQMNYHAREFHRLNKLAEKENSLAKK